MVRARGGRCAAWWVGAACAAGMLASGCVTERTTPTRSGTASTRAASPTKARQSGEPVDLSQPIARPALEGKTVNARVLAAVTPLGSVPFDGQVLPMVSPDGTLLATEAGEAPPWDALLGRRAGGPTLRTSIEVWNISKSPATRVTMAEPLHGVMLGRSCDGEGFLVEEVRPDGSRRIGKAAWLSGKVTWLVDDGRVNAFGVLLEGGGAAWCSRDINQETFGLVVRGKRVAGGPGISMLFPMTGGEADTLYVFEASNFGMEVQARSLKGGGAPGSIVKARRSIGASADAIVAYQAADPQRGCVGALGRESAPGLLFFHPGGARMAVFDAGHGQMTPLAEKSIAGAWAPDDVGWAAVVTTPEGLEHQRLEKRDGLWEALPAARALGDPWVARRTASADRPFVLLGPNPKDPRRITVIGMELLSQDQALSAGQ